MKEDFKDFDLAKALRTVAARQNQTGVEELVNDEGIEEFKRLSRQTYAPGLVIPSKVLRNLTNKGNYVYQPEIAASSQALVGNGILSKLGITVFDDIEEGTSLRVTHRNNPVTKALAEGESYGNNDNEETTDSLDRAIRVQGSITLSNEYLVQVSSSEELVLTIVESIEAEIARVIFEKILTLPALPGYEAAATAAALDWTGVQALKNSLKSPRLRSPRFVTSGQLYGTLEATAKSASVSSSIIDRGMISSHQAIDAEGLVPSGEKNSLIFGDFSRALLGLYGPIHILGDKFTKSNEGKTIFTWTRYADVTVSPYHFSSIQNATL
jgi:hypothetical protein